MPHMPKATYGPSALLQYVVTTYMTNVEVLNNSGFRVSKLGFRG